MTKHNDPWSFLRQFTHARIGIGRVGQAITTKELLDFRRAFSRARDSVWSEVSFVEIEKVISTKHHPSIAVSSACKSKQEFLLNPSLGRQLNEQSNDRLRDRAPEAFECAFVIADGLSANAVHENALPFMETFLDLMDRSKVKLSPIVLAKYARVALGDEIGKLLNATTTLMLIGERPGLASSDSLSVYFTYQPEPGRNDAHRNCISNIHKSGISPHNAAQMAHFLFQAAFQKKLSGVDLKIEYPALVHR